MINQFLIQQMFNISPEDYYRVMQHIQGKNPQELEQYVRNQYKSADKDINEKLNEVRMKCNQFGIKL